MFDWHTDEETVWEEAKSPKRMPASSRQRVWKISLILLAVGIVALLLYRAAAQQIEQANSQIEAELLSSRDLNRQAVERRDKELFTSTLSGREPGWTSAMQYLFVAGWRQEGFSAFGLIALDAPQIESVTIDPALNAGMVEATQTFSLPNPIHNQSQITLKTVELYRRGSTRWLLSPPDDAFWGESLTFTGERLQATYPQRDSEIIESLAPEIDRWLGEMCSQIAGIQCEPSYRMQIIFSTELTALTSLIEPESWLQAGVKVTLPTPSLIGLPADETGERYLGQIYSRLALSAAIGEQMGYACCRHIAFHQALLQMQLVQLGFSPPSDHTPIYQTWWGYDSMGRANRQVVMGWSANELANAPNSELIIPYFAFLLDQNPNLAVTDLHRHLAVEDNFRNYMLYFMPDFQLVGDDSYYERAWYDFLRRQLPAEITTPPIPLPTAKLALGCQNSLYQYELQTEETTLINQSHSYRQIMPAVNGGGLYLFNYDQPRATSNGSLHLNLWQNNQLQLVHQLPLNNATWLNAFTIDPLGRTLPLSQFQEDNWQTWLVDLTALPDSDSPLIELGKTIPIWSPDGSKTLLHDYNTGSLALGDDKGQIIRPLINKVIVPGFANFLWLDNDRFLYTHAPIQSKDGMALSQINLYALSTGKSERLVGVTDFDFLPDHILPATIVINTIAYSPKAPHRIVLNIFAQNNSSYTNTLIYNLIERKVETDFNGVAYFGTQLLSPNGRWLLAGFTSANEALIHNLDNNITRNLADLYPSRFNNGVWSPDGNWLVLQSRNKIVLYAPEHDYLHRIFPVYSDCFETSWFDG